MTNLQSYYNKRVQELEPDQHLEQVGHTVSGQAISDNQFSLLINDLLELLVLEDSDVVLDLGCGNGLITAQLADHCGRVYAVDFSVEMIKLAVELNNKSNILYIEGDLLDLDSANLPARGFSKVLMYGALQHVKTGQFKILLASLLPYCRQEVCLVFGFVPDRQKRWKYYDSLARKYGYLLNRLLGRDVMGTWWSKKKIGRICDDLQLAYTFNDIPAGQYGYPYRYHVVIRRSHDQ